MERAKQVVSDFISHDGKHKTTYDEEVRPAVTSETVRPHQHENVTTAVDKEVHQDHHHTIVQPLTHKETLPEQHTHNVIPVEHKTIHHGNKAELDATLTRDATQYRDASVTHDTTHSTSAAPVVTGERTHHHVHEHVQPVVHKETIQPHVVHTTVPIHETHHAEAVHHGTSTLPAKTLGEFVEGKGTIEGRSTTHISEFDGCPKPYNENMQTERLDADKDMHLRSHHHTHGDQRTREGDVALAAANTATHSHARDGQSTLPHSGVDGRGTHDTTGFAGDHATRKPSLAQKLNPFTDADGDGKKGFLD